MIYPQDPTYALIYDCLKEALYAAWQEDTERTQRYLLLAKSRIQELHQLHQSVSQRPDLLSKEPSLQPYPKFLRLLVQTTSQYARTCTICQVEETAIAVLESSQNLKAPANTLTKT